MTVSKPELYKSVLTPGKDTTMPIVKKLSEALISQCTACSALLLLLFCLCDNGVPCHTAQAQDSHLQFLPR